MWFRVGVGSSTVVLPLATASQQQCAFHLCARHRLAVLNSTKRPAMNAQRRRSVRTLGNDARAHLAKGRDHLVHWAFGQARISTSRTLEFLAGQQTREKAHGRARIATIDFLAWCGRSPFFFRE